MGMDLSKHPRSDPLKDKDAAIGCSRMMSAAAAS